MTLDKFLIPEQLPQDPRDFFKITRFEKTLEEITNKTFPKATMENMGRYVKDGKIRYISAVYKDITTRQKFVVAGLETADKTHPVICTDQEKIEEVAEFLGGTLPKLNTDTRRNSLPTIFSLLEGGSDIETIKSYFESSFQIGIDWKYVVDIQPIPFDVKEHTHRQINDIESLEAILRETAFLPEPEHIQSQRFSKSEARFVKLDTVVGASGTRDWSLRGQGTRGLNHIFEIAKSYQEGTRQLYDKGDPIEGTVHEGKVWITQNGRHRTATLKALGVTQIPMLIRETL